MSRDRAAADEMVRHTGQMGVPVTAIGGEYVVGFDRPKLARIAGTLRAAAPKPATLGAAVKDAPEGGALVGAVRPDTPAARAGLAPGDTIEAVDDAPVGGADALARLIGAARERGGATLRVRRQGQIRQIPIRFG